MRCPSLLLIAATLGVVCAELATAIPLIPRDAGDPFYNPPFYFRAVPNGAILRTRQLDGASFNFSTPIEAAYQILYKTEDPVTHEDISTALTAIVPKAALLNGEKRDLLSIQVPYDAADKDCGPSYLSNSNRTADPTGGSGPFVDLALFQNLTVLLSDYEGPKAGFTVGKLSGQGVVDGVRAALQFEKVVPCKEKTQVVFEGFSGGALATGWAVQVQPTYAPELSKYIRGAAFGGLPRNLTRDLIFLDGGVQSGLVVSSIAGEAAIFPDLNRFLNKHLNDAGRQAIAFARDNCLTPVLAQYPNTSFFETFTDLTRDQALANPVVRNTQAQLLLAAPGSSVPHIPLFIYHGTGDKTVPFQDTVDYYNVQCARGIKSLTRLDVNGTDHTTTDALIQGAQARQFLLQRLAGVPAPKGCSKSEFFPTPQAVQAVSMAKRATLHEY